MNKLKITLCWDCQKLMADGFKVMALSTDTDKKPKCDNCGKTYGLKVCYIGNKED